MPESPPKRPTRPPGQGGGTPQQTRSVPQAEYHHIPINDSHDDPHKLPGPILLQPEKSPMLAEMQSPYQPTSIALETKDLFIHRWLHRRAQVFCYFQLLFALVLLILGIVSVVVRPTFYHVGVGFWLAIFTIVAAAVGLLAARFKTQELVGVFLVLSAVAVFLCFCGLTVVAVGLSKDIESYDNEAMLGHKSESENTFTTSKTTTRNVSIHHFSSNTSVAYSTSSRPSGNDTQNTGFGDAASNTNTNKTQHSKTSKVAVGAFLVIAVSMEIIMALLSWLTSWHALCGSRRKGDCVSEMVDFCSDTLCFCCTTP